MDQKAGARLAQSDRGGPSSCDTLLGKDERHFVSYGSIVMIYEVDGV